MDLVVDANVLFSALIKQSKTCELLFVNHFHLYAPEFIFDELEKYKEELLEKTERTEEEFYKFLEILKRRIMLFPLDELVPFAERAENISPDPKDAVYFALALKLNIDIWSNDKQLKKQNAVKIYSTEDLVSLT